MFRLRHKEFLVTRLNPIPIGSLGFNIMPTIIKSGTIKKNCPCLSLSPEHYHGINEKAGKTYGLIHTKAVRLVASIMLNATAYNEPFISQI